MNDFSEKSLKVQMRHRAADGEKIEDLQCQPDGSFAKEHRAQKTVESLQIQFDTLRGTVDSNRRGLPSSTELVRT